MRAHLVCSVESVSLKPAGIESDIPSRVFTPSFMDSLERSNRVVRMLHELGLVISGVRCEVSGPVVRIAPVAGVTLDPLLDRLGPRRYRPVEGGTEISGEIDGVIVSWHQSAAVVPPIR
ncbi:MAG: hypothetical protein VB141_12855 [Burkholderia gladioli]